MSTTNDSIRQANVSLNLPTKTADLIFYSNNVVTKMTNNPYFPTPTPTIAEVATATTDLSTTQTAALSRAKGAAATRNTKRVVLVGLLRHLGGYVQSVASAAPENSAAIIKSAGFEVRKVAQHGKRSFAAKLGGVSGSVVVTAVTAGARASYDWEYSVDGGKTWVQMPSTIQGKTTIAGLATGTTVLFRYRTVTPKAGQGDWTPATSIFVQ